MVELYILSQNPDINDPFTPISELVIDTASRIVTPVDKRKIARYEFYILAQIKGQAGYTASNKETLIVGCAFKIGTGPYDIHFVENSRNIGNV